MKITTMKVILLNLKRNESKSLITVKDVAFIFLKMMYVLIVALRNAPVVVEFATIITVEVIANGVVLIAFVEVVLKLLLRLLSEMKTKGIIPTMRWNLYVVK